MQWHSLWMRLLATSIAAIALASCGAAHHEDKKLDGADQSTTPFPADDTRKLLSGTLVEVPRSGQFVWNGQPVNGATLSEYLGQYAQASKDSGRVVVQFEPGTSRQRITWVRHQIIGAGFCGRGHCAEAAWKATRPVVN